MLNQNAVIREWERAQGAFNNIVRVLLDCDIGILQLPCPEFTYLGERRPPMTKVEYDTEEYHLHCRKLAIPMVNQIDEYVKNDYEIIGLIGIQGSPSCDRLGQGGIFMEEFIGLLEKENIHLKVFDIPEQYLEGHCDEVVDGFKQFIK